MSVTIDRRVLALEARQGPREPVAIIRIVTMPGQQDAEPDHANVRGMTIHRMADETAAAFMTRVETEAKLGAMLGSVAAALVFPRTGTTISVEGEP